MAVNSPVTVVPHPSSSGSNLRVQPPRQQYLDLRASVHKKLLARLNLEALAQSDRSRAESEIRILFGEILTEEGTPISLSERETLFSELLDDVFGLGRSSRCSAIRPSVTSSSTRTSMSSSSAAASSKGSRRTLRTTSICSA